MAKIIQIVVADHMIHALDSEGNVWKEYWKEHEHYIGDTKEWERVPLPEECTGH